MAERFVAAASIAAALFTACASTPPIEIPRGLEPAPGETLAMVVPARGVQVYECRAKNGGSGAEWAFVAPEAELFDGRGRPIGRHGAGPHWQAFDGSRVVGSVKARADAPVAGAIPWLLLAARSTGGNGAFTGVTSIQRVRTVGGVAPADGCDAGSLGKPLRIAYSADYHFYRAGY